MSMKWKSHTHTSYLPLVLNNLKKSISYSYFHKFWSTNFYSIRESKEKHKQNNKERWFHFFNFFLKISLKCQEKIWYFHIIFFQKRPNKKIYNEFHFCIFCCGPRFKNWYAPSLRIFFSEKKRMFFVQPVLLQIYEFSIFWIFKGKKRTFYIFFK
jgi:hypothetical protein